MQHINCRFKMAEDVDSQLKRMAEDLKEIIEQMNASNSNQGQDQSPVSQSEGVELVGVVIICPFVVLPDCTNTQRSHGVAGLDRQRDCFVKA